MFVTQKRFESFIQEVDLAEKTKIPYDISCSENILLLGNILAASSVYSQKYFTVKLNVIDLQY